MIDLPESNDCTNLMVVTDYLGKGLELVPVKDLETETAAWHFIDRIVGYHGLPTAIVSDRGAQWTGGLWRRVCELLKIEQRLSIAYRPETDGATERAN